MWNIITLTKNKVMAGEKVFILSDYLAMQRSLEQELKAAGLGVTRFKTSWGNEQRTEAMESFANDPEVTVMIAGTRAVSEALDFSAANTCICCDLLWAPAFQQQAWSRILQATKRRRLCDIIMVLSGNSIDEHKYETFYAKLVASEQSQDRKVVNRRAMTVDIKMFADRVIEEEANLTRQMRDLGFDNDEEFFVLPDINAGLLEERVY
jgi:SNF2 family DNA or RNA helicase